MQKFNMETRDKINTEAWDILNDDEKTAISLSLGHNKSTWESGEIMKKAHFKYLEIQKRSRKFLEIFTIHFEKYRGLFPEGLHLTFAFKEYVMLTVLDRKNISQAVKSMEDPSYSIASKRSKLIITEINRIKENDSELALDFYSLIMDFDRWNNFRILPLEIQEPSAFKRRNKVRNVKHLKNITTLPQFSVLKVISRFSYSGKYNKLYLSMISPHLDDDYKVITIKDNESIIRDITNIGLFIFNTKEEAEEFCKLIVDYFLNVVKNCKNGQKFWPEFRVLMVKAYNYKGLENIHKSRTYLDTHTFNQDRRKVKNRKNKIAKGEDRAEDPDIFYL